MFKINYSFFQHLNKKKYASTNLIIYLYTLTIILIPTELKLIISQLNNKNIILKGGKFKIDCKQFRSPPSIRIFFNFCH